MELFYLLLWLGLQAAICCCQLAFLKRDLSVKIGRSVYLEPQDLVFQDSEKGEKCRVEVITNDPITQRVGYLEPQVFDCHFPEDSVRYVHSGSPLLSTDKIKLRSHRFYNKKTVSSIHFLHILVKNESYDIIKTKGLKPLTVTSESSLSNALDSSVLNFLYSWNLNISCSVGFSRYKSNWPIAGQMVLGEKGRLIEAIKKDCHEFLLMDLHYEHVKTPSPILDYLPLVINLYDPLLNKEITERFFFPIYITIQDAIPNSPPRASFKSMYIMDVDQFILTTLIPGVISAEDYETPASQLIFNISKPPGPGNGYVVRLDDHTQSITSFIQDDLDNLHIGYQPPNTSYSERKVYTVEFTVFDSHFAASMPIMLHIAVRPSSTNAPRVSYNTGLVLLEGQSQTIYPNNLQIVDKDNIEKVKIFVKGGLDYGNLKINGKSSIYFTPTDIQSGLVVYQHDDSDSTRDSIELRISDGRNTVRASFPITIIPKDDSSPYLVNNLGLELNEGGIGRINHDALLAHDTDSLDAKIIFTIIKTPKAGEIFLKVRPHERGQIIQKFTQTNLMKGQVYYKHMNTRIHEDSFGFVLTDQQDPPNVSQRKTFQIHINSISNNPPIQSLTSSQFMQVQETNIAFLTKSQLHYLDKDSTNKELVYIVTVPPYFVYNSKRADAGRLIATHNLTMVRKNPSIPPILSFTQEDINHLKVAYMPPTNDIGTESCLVRFMYTIQDTTQNKIVGKHFDIEVQPVDNQPPEFITNKLLVEEGGTIEISSNQISAMDIDTISGELSFVCEQLPRYGMLQKNGNNLKKGDRFRLMDLKEKIIRYIQDGSEVILDSFLLTLTDGIHKVTKDITIDIVPIDDQAPRLRDGLKPHLIVSEGNEAIFTPSVLSAKDADTDDELLTFLIVKQPRYGIIKVHGHPVTKFSQQDIKEKVVKYIHIGGEIGPVPKQDSVTFIVSDQNYVTAVDLPIYELNITITPVNNQKPRIITGNPILVQEGKTFKLTIDNLSAEDIDTLPRSIRFMVIRQPQWGYLENIKPSLGSEKSNAGIQISLFRLQDIMDESINYVQTNHIGVEPLYDSIELYAMDGKLHSSTETLRVNIIPINDEIPDVMLQDFAILEGGTKIINQSIVDAIDLDQPKDPLMFSISKPPKNGKVIILLQTKSGPVEEPVRDFSIDELHSGMQLKYIHDNSENFHDHFVLVVSDGKNTIKKTCNITIISVNDEKPVVVKNQGLHIGYGDFGLISSVVLYAEDKDTDDSKLFFVIISIPKMGILQYRKESDFPASQSRWFDLETGLNFTQSDINRNHVRYIHTGNTAESKSDRFLFVLTDGVNQQEVKSFEVSITNSKNTHIDLLNRGLRIEEGARVILSTDVLSASDGSTKAEEIIFTVTTPPSLGQLEYINMPFVSINSFSQLDLAGQQVVYNHLAKSDITEDSFSFTVANGMKSARDEICKIFIKPLDKVLPTLEVNNPIQVLQGAEISITPLHLKVSDPDSSVKNLTFIIMKPPSYGHLYNRDILIIQAFSQHDINLGYITYESDGSQAGLDHFLFKVSDGHHKGFLINSTLQTHPVVSSIHIKSLLHDAPQLQIKKEPVDLEYFGKDRYGFKLTSKNLKSVDSDTESSHLFYIIIKRPQHGHIENVIAKRYVHRRFTQKDLDDHSLVYVINAKTQQVNDSFSFRVEDYKGNSLENQKFDLSWSRIEFLMSDYVTCENVGTLSLTIIRTGALDRSAFVGIRVRQMSAKMQEDFIPSTAKQIQFDPGMTKATWNVLIEKDLLEENKEKFKVILHTPVNTVLGEKNKAKVQIINARDGKCPQYIGMISKDHPVPLTGSSDPLHLQGTETKYHGFTKLQLLDSPDGEHSFQVPQSKPKKAKKKTKKGKKPKKRKKKKKPKKKKKNQKKKIVKKTSSTKLQSPEKTNYPPLTVPVQEGTIKAAQKCTGSTKGRLLFDVTTKKLYRCDGKQWAEWHLLHSQGDEESKSGACPQEWSEFQGQCYKFINDKMTWNDAERTCRGSHSAHLASVLSGKHHRWLRSLTGKNAFWIGLNDKSETGKWVYMTGDPLHFTRWRKGRPRIKRSKHQKNCVFINRKLKWVNKKCDRPKKKFICQKAAISLRHKYRNLPSRYRERRYFNGH